MADLGLLQAWGMWFDNVQVNQHTLFGWSILGLGRVGKVTSFVAGLTVVLDLIGPERLREFARRHRRFDPVTSKGLPLSLLVGLSTLGVLVIVMVSMGVPKGRELAPFVQVMTVICGLLLVVAAMPFTVRGIARILEHQRTERVVRWLGVALLLLGFHFDLLAS